MSQEATLSKPVDLAGADRANADLANAELTGAVGATVEQLAKAKSLRGATLPDGSKHESVSFARIVSWVQERLCGLG